MTKETADKVASLLGLVEAQLTKGRPRKMPGRPRPEAVDVRGVPCRIDKTQFWLIDKVSLSAAFRLAAKEEGFSPYILHVAKKEFRWASDMNGDDYIPLSIREIDARQLDTRQLIRAARRARRWVECYGKQAQRGRVVPGSLAPSRRSNWGGLGGRGPPRRSQAPIDSLQEPKGRGRIDGPPKQAVGAGIEPATFRVTAGRSAG